MNAPKRPATAFMLWLNESRKKIIDDNPGIKVTEVAKKGGELWRDLGDKSVSDLRVYLKFRKMISSKYTC